MEYAGVEDKVAVKCQGGVSPKSDSGIKRPQVAALLQRSQYTGFGMGCGDAAMPSAGVFPSETGRSVGNGLYTHIGGILFTAAVLYEDVDRKVQCMCGSGACRMFAQRGLLCPSYGESFLVGRFLKDVALPVYPHIAVPALAVDKDLRSRFGIVGEQEFGVVER